MLKLTLSPEKMTNKVAEIVKNLKPGGASAAGEEELAEAVVVKSLEEMVRLSCDPVFISKFNRSSVKGIDCVVDAVQNGRATGLSFFFNLRN